MYLFFICFYCRVYLTGTISEQSKINAFDLPIDVYLNAWDLKENLPSSKSNIFPIQIITKFPKYFNER